MGIRNPFAVPINRTHFGARVLRDFSWSGKPCLWGAPGAKGGRKKAMNFAQRQPLVSVEEIIANLARKQWREAALDEFDLKCHGSLGDLRKAKVHWQ